ncbi:hypothetical protein AB4574_28545, partial [Vibrio sp. 10N.222.49.E5]
SNIQTLLVGDDHLPRSLAHSQESINLSLDVVDKALAGETAVGTFDNTQDQAIIAAYTPIDLKYATWALVVELPEKEAFARI